MSLVDSPALELEEAKDPPVPVDVYGRRQLFEGPSCVPPAHHAQRSTSWKLRGRRVQCALQQQSGLGGRPLLALQMYLHHPENQDFWQSSSSRRIL